MSPKLRNPSVRWVILALACWLMASNFYAYDLPASLNKPMQEWLGLSDGDFAYAVNAFYSVYSFPNCVLPFFGGYLIDRFGVRKLMVILSLIQFVGQIVFSIGNDNKSVGIMLFGRFLFGVGGESLSVAQNSVTARYFRGKELALALGLNLAIARLGSVANDIVSPVLAVRFSVPVAVWVGTVTCGIAFICSIILGWLDAKLTRESERDSVGGAPPDVSNYRHLAEEDMADKDSDRMSELPLEAEIDPSAQPMPAPAVAGLSRSSSVKLSPVAAEESLLASRHHDQQYTAPQAAQPPQSHHDEVYAASRASFTTIRLSLPPSPNPGAAFHHITRIPSFSDFPVSFHLLMLVIVFQYATVVPFGTIHSALLQLKWYPNDPEKAGEIMALPDTISALMVPFVGTFTDHYGKRTQSLTVCGLLMSFAHLLIGFASPPGFISTPVPALIMLGLGYGLLGVLWSAVPILVPEETGLQGTAFGIATAIFNFSTFLFPILIALLINVDPSYFSVQMMFATCCALGALTSHAIPRFDLTGKIDAPESANVEDSGTDGGVTGLAVTPNGHSHEPDEIPLVARTGEASEHGDDEEDEDVHFEQARDPERRPDQTP